MSGRSGNARHLPVFARGSLMIPPVATWLADVTGQGVHANASSNLAPGAGRLRGAGPLLGGIAAIAILVPLRELWPVQVILLGLLLLVPGLALLRLARVPNRSIAATAIYVPAASLTILMAVGLAVDLIGPWVGIVAPLRTLPLLVGVLVACLAFVGAAALGDPRPRGSQVQVRLPRVRDLLPLLLPLGAAAGAARLTAGHGAGLAIGVTAVSIAAAVLVPVLAPRMGRTQIVIMLYGVALAFVWAFSLRTGSVVGWDIASEAHVVQSTQASGVWHVSHPNDNYGALLSLTVLPSVLHEIAGLSDLTLLKAVYPALWALFPVITFTIARRHLTPRYAALAAVLVMTPSAFMTALPALARQEIALVICGALIALVLDGGVPRRSRLSLTMVFGIGVVVSHYSSTYFMIEALVVALLLQMVVSFVRPIPRVNAGFACALVAMMAGAILWYGPITEAGGNVNGLVDGLAANGVAIVHSDPLTAAPGPTTIDAATYTHEVVQSYAKNYPYLHPLPDAGLPRYQIADTSTPGTVARAPSVNNAFGQFAALMAIVLSLIAAIAAMILAVRRRTSTSLRGLAFLAVGTLPLLVAVHFSSVIAAQYGPERVAIQALLLLSIVIAWACQVTVGRLRRLGGIAICVIAASVAVLLCDGTGLAGAVFGSSTTISLTSRGAYVEEYETTANDLAAATWLGAHNRVPTPVYSDTFGMLSLHEANGNAYPVFSDLVPQVIDHYAWVYLSTRNVVDDRAESQFSGFDVTYRPPMAFLDDNFNAVYSNGSSEVLHR